MPCGTLDYIQWKIKHLRAQLGEIKLDALLDDKKRLVLAAHVLEIEHLSDDLNRYKNEEKKEG